MDSLTPISRHGPGRRTSDRVHAALVAAIRNLDLPPGRVLSENDLAARLSVSRTPVRDAIARLAGDGLVTVIPQVGTRVALIDPRDVEEARFVRETLEIAVFEEACRRDDRDVSALRVLLEKQEAARRDGDHQAFFAADDAMHEQIFALGGHPGAWQAVERMKVQLDRVRHLNQTGAAAVRTLIADHTAIVDALEAGQIEPGRHAIRTHTRRARAAVEALPARFPDYFTA